HDVAMTGEVTLSGRVLPIGGVKEKVLGAVRSGITTIVLPKENLADLEDLNQEVRDRLTVHAVDELSQVFAVALRKPSNGVSTDSVRVPQPEYAGSPRSAYQASARTRMSAVASLHVRARAWSGS